MSKWFFLSQLYFQKEQPTLPPPVNIFRLRDLYLRFKKIVSGIPEKKRNISAHMFPIPMKLKTIFQEDGFHISASWIS